jgi:hypothetical protein
MGATQKSQSCASARPPTKSAGRVLRAGLTERLVTGIPIRWIRVSPSPIAMGAKHDGQRSGAGGASEHLRHDVGADLRPRVATSHGCELVLHGFPTIARSPTAFDRERYRVPPRRVGRQATWSGSHDHVAGCGSEGLVGLE